MVENNHTGRKPNTTTDSHTHAVSIDGGSAVEVGTSCAAAEPDDGDADTNVVALHPTHGADPYLPSQPRPSTIVARILACVERATTEYWHDDHGGTYVTLDNGEHHQIGSKRFRTWMARQLHQQHGEAPPAAALQTAVTTLEGRARFGGDNHSTHLRVALVDDIIYIDVGDADRHTIQVTAESWEVTRESPPVRFLRPDGMLPLPPPQRGGTWTELWDLLPIDEPDRLPVFAWLQSSLRPGYPHPILVFVGGAGAGKSTTARILRGLVDPNLAALHGKLASPRDIAIAAQHRWVGCFDNISKISDAMSDHLCRLATGASFATRQLYTDADEQV